MTDLTLCTFTYNDARLASGLIASSREWPVMPAALVVTDDGSTPPYCLPQPATFADERLIRLEQNQGPAVAKSTGISAAASRMVISMDCDMRLAPGWLEQALPLANRPDVGVVGCPFYTDGGPGLTGRYLALFDREGKAEGETDFLTGAVWLFRREVWLAANGFDGYTARTHEDHHFCRLVRKLGLKLLVAGEPGRQVRRLSRRALAQRFAAWLGPDMGKSTTGPEALNARALLLAADMTKRLEIALGKNEPGFIYLELLLLLCFGAACCDGLKNSHPAEASAARAGLVQGIGELLAPTPRLAALFRADCLALGQPPDASAPANPAPWEGALAVLDTLARTGLLTRLDAMLPLLVEDDADFSFYEHSPV